MKRGCGKATNVRIIWDKIVGKAKGLEKISSPFGFLLLSLDSVYAAAASLNRGIDPSRSLPSELLRLIPYQNRLRRSSRRMTSSLRTQLTWLLRLVRP